MKRFSTCGSFELRLLFIFVFLDLKHSCFGCVNKHLCVLDFGIMMIAQVCLEIFGAWVDRGGGGWSWVLTLSPVPGKSVMAIGLLRNTGTDLIQKQFDHKGPDV